MSFTALFVALLLERFFDSSHLRKWGWYANLQRIILAKVAGQSPYVVLAALILPLALAVLIIQIAIYNTLFGFIKLVFGVVVLLYCFGPRNLWADTFASINALTDGDKQAAEEKLRVAFEISDTADPQKAHRQLVERIFTQANYRVFGVVIWYALLGLPGAVIYRLAGQIIPDAGNVAPQVEAWLNWVSTRAFAFLFAAGNRFNQVFSVWRKEVVMGPEANDKILVNCGILALNRSESDVFPVDGAVEKEAVSLIDRAMAVLLVVVALLVLIIP